jgi:hypothetical protein
MSSVEKSLQKKKGFISSVYLHIVACLATTAAKKTKPNANVT